MKLFISPSEQAGKITEAEYFTNRLMLKWPNAIVKLINDVNRNFILEWEINIDKRYLSGKMDKTEDMLVVEFSDIEFGADFCIWAYHNLSKSNDIIVYDDDYTSVLPLTITSTADDVVKAFS